MLLSDLLELLPMTKHGSDGRRCESSVLLGRTVAQMSGHPVAGLIMQRLLRPLAPRFLARDRVATRVSHV